MLLGQRWRAELRGLSPAINTACLTAAPHICSVYSQVVSLQADVQHLKLPSLPTQRSWKRTHQRAGCPPVTSHDFGWQQQTCHSWLAGLRKGRLHQVGGPVLSKASVLLLFTGIFTIPTTSYWEAVQRLWHLHRTPQLLSADFLPIHADLCYPTVPGKINSFK